MAVLGAASRLARSAAAAAWANPLASLAAVAALPALAGACLVVFVAWVVALVAAPVVVPSALLAALLAYFALPPRRGAAEERDATVDPSSDGIVTSPEGSPALALGRMPSVSLETAAEGAEFAPASELAAAELSNEALPAHFRTAIAALGGVSSAETSPIREEALLSARSPRRTEVTKGAGLQLLLPPAAQAALAPPPPPSPPPSPPPRSDGLASAPSAQSLQELADASIDDVMRSPGAPVGAAAPPSDDDGGDADVLPAKPGTPAREGLAAAAGTGGTASPRRGRRRRRKPQASAA